MPLKSQRSNIASKFVFAPTHGLPITDVKATVPKVQEGLKAAALMPESGTNEKMPLTGAAASMA